MKVTSTHAEANILFVLVSTTSQLGTHLRLCAGYRSVGWVAQRRPLRVRITRRCASVGTVTANKPSAVIEEDQNGTPEPKKFKLGFSFSPAGLLFPYYLGVAKSLRDCGALTDLTPIAGASAGALVCAVIGCGLDPEDIAADTLLLCDECRDGGTRFRLKGILERTLERMLPEDAHEVLNSRAADVGVSMTHIFPPPWPIGKTVTEFHSRQDLIRCLLGSCCVPFWFNGWPAIWVRNRLTVDGFFASPRGVFGAPSVPQAEHTIRVSAFPASVVGLLSMQDGDVISPDLLGQSYGAFEMQVLAGSALNPGEDKALQKLYDDGYLAAQTWVRKHGEEYLEPGEWNRNAGHLKPKHIFHRDDSSKEPGNDGAKENDKA